MTIRKDVVAFEVVKSTREQVVYVCDGCAAEYVLGTPGGHAVNTLHPPRAWWRVAPADSSDLSDGGREKYHLCSIRCLRQWAKTQAERH